MFIADNREIRTLASEETRILIQSPEPGALDHSARLPHVKWLRLELLRVSNIAMCSNYIYKKGEKITK
jgi:hypothetical protein